MSAWVLVSTKVKVRTSFSTRYINNQSGWIWHSRNPSQLPWSAWSRYLASSLCLCPMLRQHYPVAWDSSHVSWHACNFSYKPWWTWCDRSFFQWLLQVVHVVIARDIRVTGDFSCFFHSRQGALFIMRHFDRKRDASTKDTLMQKHINGAGHI